MIYYGANFIPNVMTEDPYTSQEEYIKEDPSLALEIYLSEIDREVLDKEQEIKLSSMRECGLYARHSLESDKDLSDIDREQLETIVKNGKDAEDILIEKHQWFVLAVAKRYDSIPQEDAIQQANIGLLKALKKYDYTKGRLSQYAIWYMFREIEAFELAPKKRVLIENESLYKTGTRELENEILDKVGDEEYSKILLNELGRMSEREATIVIKRCGLNGEEALSYKEIAHLLNMSEPGVRRIFSKKLFFLARKIAKNYKYINLGYFRGENEE